MIKLQALFDRLQRDVSRKTGLQTVIDISRAPHHEALWKDLLDMIEWLGSERISDVVVCQEGETLSGSSFGLYTLPELYAQARFHSVLTATRRQRWLLIPDELIDICYAFMYTLNPGLLQALRQLCLFTYKCKSHEVTEEQRLKAIAGFRSRNTTCQRLSESYYSSKARDGNNAGQALSIAKLLMGIILDRVDWVNIHPAHGPGSVSDSKRGIQKWRKIDGRTTRLCDKFYPIAEYFTPTPDLFDYKSASWAVGTAKLAIVPKDRRGPRIICTQPVGLMWIQQGQWRALRRAIETSRIVQTNRPLGDGSHSSIQFTRQEINGSLALESSRTRELATIDLSDASDLVSWGLVRFLCNKRNRQFLAASRATHVKIDGSIERLHMFAPMGSATCFPIETLVFWVLATARNLVSRGVTYADLRGRASAFLALNRSEVFVFGDDILVRSETCKDVCDFFLEVGFKPNLRKTFSGGFYRESCGVDAFHGVRLDIVRLQTLTLTSMSDAYALIDLANRARGMGMEDTADYLECIVESWLALSGKLRGGLAVGLTGSLWRRNFPRSRLGALQALAWNLSHHRRIRYNTDLQRWEAWTIVARPLPEREPEDGRCRLFRGLTTAVDEHTVDWLSPDNQQYHLGWVAAF